MSDVVNSGKMPGGITGKGYQPGQTGNPHGVPRWVTEARAAMRGGLYALATRHLTRVLGGVPPPDSTPAEDALYADVTLEDRNAAARLVIEYSIPKPKHAVAHKVTGADGGGVVVQVVTLAEEKA